MLADVRNSRYSRQSKRSALVDAATSPKAAHFRVERACSPIVELTETAADMESNGRPESSTTSSMSIDAHTEV